MWGKKIVLPWVSGTPLYEDGYVDRLSKHRIRVEFLHYADDALSQFNQVQYPLIIINTTLSYRNVRLEWHQLADVPIKLVREIRENTINRKTPLILTSYSKKEKDPLLERVISLQKELGDIEYFPLPDTNIDSLVKEIVLRRK